MSYWFWTGDDAGARAEAQFHAPVNLKLVSREIGTRQIADKVFPNRVFHSTKALLGRREGIIMVKVEQVNDVYLQPLKRGIDGFLNGAPCQTAVVWRPVSEYREHPLGIFVS